jgi:apolipoprotein N-acyltransferase
MQIDKTSLWLPFVSGILLSLTLPAFGLWPLVWVALVPFFIFVSQKTLSDRKLCLGTLLFGIPYAIAVTYPLMSVTSWWWGAGSESFGSSLLEFQFALIVFVVGLWGALFFLPIAYIARHRGGKAYGGILIVLTWIVVEWLRSSFALFGYSWGVLGYTLLDTHYLKHTAALFDVYTLSLLVIVVNVSLVELYRLFTTEERRWKALAGQPQKYVYIWFGVFMCISLFGFGLFRETQVTNERCAAKLRVAVIGSKISTGDSVGVSAYQHYRAKTEEALTLGAKIIVLPENVFPFFEINELDGTLNTRNAVPIPEQEALYADFLSLSRAYPDVSITAGLHTKIGGARYNALVVFENGMPKAYYHKRKLVPFAEYAPFGLNMSIVIPFAQGEKKQYFSIQGMKSTALVCSEVNDASISLGGAQLIISPSNDSVFGGEAIQLVHERMARMRALESGAFLLRATKGGISSIIDPSGVVVKENRGEEILVADICAG